MSEHNYDHTGSCFKECLGNPFKPIGAKYPGEFSHQYSNLLGGHSDHYVGYPGKEAISATAGSGQFDTRLVVTVPHWLDNTSGQSKSGVTAGFVQQVSSDGWAKRLKMTQTNPLQDLFNDEESGLKEYGTSSYIPSDVTATNKYLDCTRVKQYLAGETSAEHIASTAPPTTGPSVADGGPVISTTDVTEFIRNAPIDVLRFTKFGIKITTDTPKEMVGGHYWYCLVNGSEPANLCEIDEDGGLNLMTQDQCIESIVATRGWKKIECGRGPLSIVLNPMERRSFMYSQALLPSANDIRAQLTYNSFFPEASSIDHQSKTNNDRAKARMAMGLWQKLILYSTARNTAFGTSNAKQFVPLSIEFFYCVEYVPPIGTLAHLTCTPPAGKHEFIKGISGHAGNGRGSGAYRRLVPRGKRTGAPLRRLAAPPRRTQMAAIAGQAAQMALPHLISFAANRMQSYGRVANPAKKKKTKHPPQLPARRQPQQRRKSARR